MKVTLCYYVEDNREGGTSSLTLFDRPNSMLSDFTEVEYAAWFELYVLDDKNCFVNQTGSLPLVFHATFLRLQNDYLKYVK